MSSFVSPVLFCFFFNQWKPAEDETQLYDFPHLCGRSFSGGHLQLADDYSVFESLTDAILFMLV